MPKEEEDRQKKVVYCIVKGSRQAAMASSISPLKNILQIVRKMLL